LRRLWYRCGLRWPLSLLNRQSPTEPERFRLWDSGHSERFTIGMTEIERSLAWISTCASPMRTDASELASVGRWVSGSLFSAQSMASMLKEGRLSGRPRVAALQQTGPPTCQAARSGNLTSRGSAILDAVFLRLLETESMLPDLIADLSVAATTLRSGTLRLSLSDFSPRPPCSGG
jgi:hypothetical protein